MKCTDIYRVRLLLSMLGRLLDLLLLQNIKKRRRRKLLKVAVNVITGIVL